MRAWRWLLAMVAVSLAAGCGNPARPDCAYSVTPSAVSFGTSGGDGSEVVTPAPSTPGCSWTLRSDSSWVTLNGTPSGTRQTTVAYHVGSNTNGAARTAKISIEWDGPDGSGSTDSTISQGGAAPPVAPNQAVSASSGTYGVTVTATGSWAATVVSGASFVTITSGATGSGNGTITYAVTANTTSSARTAIIAVTGLGGSATVTITQQAPGVQPPFITLATSSVTVGSGAQSSLTDSVTSNVTWTATSDASWLHVTGGSGTTGNGTLGYAVDANGGGQRAGHLTLSGGGAPSPSLTVTQSGIGITLSVSPTNPPAVAAAGQPGLTASVTANVSWAAAVSSDATSWLSITGGASGSNSGTITYTVAGNSGGARSGTITVAASGAPSVTVTVSQLGTGPTPMLSLANPNPAQVAASGQSGISATVNSNVSWSTSVEVAAAPWLSVTPPGTGTNTASFTYSVAVNSGAARTGHVTVSGGGLSATLTVTQQAAATPFISLVNPSPSQVTANGQSGLSAQVHSNTTWTAAVDPGDTSWLSVSGASGSNDGSFAYSVGANSTAARTGHIRVKFNDGTVGDTLNVSQATGVLTASFTWNGQPCTFTATGNSGDAANHWTGCAFDGSASTGPIQTYEFHWVSPSGSLLSPAPLTSPTLSSGQAPCNLTGGVDADIDVYLIVKNGGSASAPVSRTVHVVHGGCV